MEEDRKNSKWKTTKKNYNGSRPKKSKWKTTKKIKMEDDQNNSKWKTTKKFKMKDKQKNSKWKTTNNTKLVNFCLHLLGLSYKTIIITGKPTKKNPNSELEKAEFSVQFKSVLHQVKKAGYTNSGVHQLVEGADMNLEFDSFIVAQTTMNTVK